MQQESNSIPWTNKIFLSQSISQFQEQDLSPYTIHQLCNNNDIPQKTVAKHLYWSQVIVTMDLLHPDQIKGLGRD